MDTYAPTLLPVLGIHPRQEQLPGEFQTDHRRYTGSRDSSHGDRASMAKLSHPVQDVWMYRMFGAHDLLVSKSLP